MAITDLPCIGCDTQDGCGTGLGNWPKPGDPDNNLVLTADAEFGGVNVNWTFPQVNPFAVQHTLLYRSTSADYNTATLHQVVAGNNYFDLVREEDPPTYHYWIQVVSVHGTYGDLIGPAKAQPKGLIADMITKLTGQIDNSVLAESLKTDIARIGGVEQGLAAEIINRTEANERLAEAYAQVENRVVESIAYIDREVKARTDGQQALVQEINTLMVANENSSAAIREEQAARIAADAALATQINTVQSSMGDEVASVRTELSTEIRNVDGEVKKIGALYTAKVDVNGLVGGFGIYNDGTLIDAGFDVDRFWIGRTNANKRKPFIIEDSVVYIDEGAINKLTFNKLRSDDGSLIVENGRIKADFVEVKDIQSTNYQPGSRGWKLGMDGSFELNAASSGFARMKITNQLIQIWDENNVLRVKMGIW